jgi:hypothetical protein
MKQMFHVQVSVDEAHNETMFHVRVFVDEAHNETDVSYTRIYR